MRNDQLVRRRAHGLAALLLIAAGQSLAEDCDLPQSWCDKLQSIDDVLSGKAFKDSIPDIAGMIGGDSAKNAANAGVHAYGIQREGMDVFRSGMNCLSAEAIAKGTDDGCMSQAQEQQSRFWDTSMPDRLKNMVLDVVPDSVREAYEKVESIITDANWITGKLENAKKRITDAYESVTGVSDTADSVQADIDAALNAANASFDDQWDSAMDGRLNELENELERQLASSISNTDSYDALLSSIISLAAIAALQKNPQALSCAEDLINSRPSQACISMAMEQTNKKLLGGVASANIHRKYGGGATIPSYTPPQISSESNTSANCQTARRVMDECHIDESSACNHNITFTQCRSRFMALAANCPELAEEVRGYQLQINAERISGHTYPCVE